MEWVMPLLVAARDALVALALAWVGVSFEPRNEETSARCADDANVCVHSELRTRAD